MKILSIIICGMWLQSCATSQEKIDIATNNDLALGVNVISNHPDIINTYIQPNSNQNMLCVEPDPDMVSTFSGSVSLGATVAGNNDAFSGSDGSSALATGGLSPMVLITRELLYRACELSMNSNANAEQQLAIYKMFLSTIEKLNTSNQGNVTAASGK